jgi:DNA-binding transcriptional LysR family regulator
MIDFRLLHSFVVVAETEHVGRASERLHISQSPLSRQIQKLEEQIGLRLFERERQRIRLTDDGRWLLSEARDLLARADRLERDAERMVHGERGRLSIGFVSAALWHPILPKTLRKFQRSHPHVQLQMRALTSEAQVLGVQKGDLDLGFVRRGPHADLVSLPLFDEPFALALPSRHRLSSRETIRRLDLREERWIGLSVDFHPAARAHFAELGKCLGFAPEVGHETGDRATILGLFASGLGIALLPSSARRVATEGVVFRELPWLTMATRINLVHPEVPSATAKNFAKLALDFAAATM